MARPSEYKDSTGAYRNPYFPDAELTADIFWAYFTPAVQELREMGVDSPGEANARFEKLVALLNAGEIIPSREVALYGFDPVTFVGICELNGFPWFPAFGEPNIYPQGQGFPGVQAIDPDHPPVRSFPISLKASKWPPKVPVAVPGTPASLPLVGNAMGGGYFGRGPGAGPSNVSDGTVVSQNGRQYVAHLGGGINWSCYFVEKK